VGGTDRVAVDALGGDPLTPASLQRLVDANYQGAPFGHKRLNQQPQEHSADLEARPASTAENPVVAMEALLLVQAHRAQGGSDRPGAWSENRPYEQHPSVPKDAL
jgi:hypothetical protein